MESLYNCCINDDGFYIGVYPNVREKNGIKLSEEIKSPDNTFKNPWWNGKKWEDKPIPDELIKPLFDKKQKKWIESATNEMINSEIDKMTYLLIKEWCSKQGKCEEYYLNKGIMDKNDNEYQQYYTNKQIIISNQNKKKL